MLSTATRPTMAFVFAVALASQGCGSAGGGAATSHAGSSAAASPSAGGANSGSGATAGGGGGDGSTAASAQASGPLPSRRGGLAIHVQNVRAHGNLPDDPATRLDRLDVAFELDMQHNGTEPLTGLHVERVRLVEDEGRSIVIGVTADAWNGQLEVGEHRVVAFSKTPDSASPPPSHSYCGAWMRLEITIELAGRRSSATSRRVQIACP